MSVLYYIQAQEQRSTNWPFTSCFSRLRGREAPPPPPHPPELPRGNGDRALRPPLMPVDSMTTLKYAGVSAEERRGGGFLKPPAAVMHCFLFSRAEVRGRTLRLDASQSHRRSTWIPWFLFCIQSLSRGLPWQRSLIVYSILLAWH